MDDNATDVVNDDDDDGYMADEEEDEFEYYIVLSSASVTENGILVFWTMFVNECMNEWYELIIIIIYTDTDYTCRFVAFQ